MRVGPLNLALFAIAVSFLVLFHPVNASTSAVSSTVPGADTDDGNQIAAKLNSIIIPTVDFDKLDIANALDFLTIKSKELDPDHAGVQFRLDLPSGEDAKSSLANRKASVTLDNVTLLDLMTYISAQTNLVFKIENNTVVFTPAEPATQPLETYRPYEIPLETDPSYKTYLKLKSLVAHNIDWDRVDIESALRDLTTLSKKLDPDHVGIKFLLRRPADAKKFDRNGHPVVREVSLTIDYVTLAEFLAYISEQTDLTPKIQKDAVIFVPRYPMRS
jgi:hypothetical protein